jgi:hypothetical protein
MIEISPINIFKVALPDSLEEVVGGSEKVAGGFVCHNRTG